MHSPKAKLLCFLLFLNGIRTSKPLPTRFETKSRLDISNRGYVDLVVAIRSGVEENDNLIEKLKSLLTDFSRYLHTLTGLYLQNVRILVPESWQANSDRYLPSTWETFDNSDIRIDHIDDWDGIFSHAPYTNKPSECGLPGLYIHLTPKFILEPGIASTFGGYDKVLIREWAKYRWGVFEESPDSTGAQFYASSTGDIEGTRCSKERRGTWKTTTGRKCNPTLQEADDCLFVDLNTTGPGEASIMYRQYLRGIDQFCEEKGRTSVPEVLHNIEAPNQQNRHCDRKSISQVLREHADFRKAGPEVTWSAPVFDIVRRSDKKVVLVLDRSSSMIDLNRMAILRQATYNFITRVIPDGYRLGIVQFNDVSGEADITAPLRVINDTTRQQLLTKVPDSVKGRTSIGAGVRNGIRVLEDGPFGIAAGGRMVLITDGEETEEPSIERVLVEDRRKLSTIIIHTIAVGPEADGNLESLANFTNGRHFHHPDFSTTLFDVFSQFGFGDTMKTNSEIFSSSFSLASNSNYVQSVYVDTSVEGEILFLIGADNIESLIVVIQRPDRSTITNTEYQFYRRIPDFQLIKVNTNDVMYGTWTITIRNQDTETKRVSLVVEGGVSGTTPTRTVKARWAVAEITPPNAQTLFVTVSKGYVPVGGAIVTAIVSHDTWQMETRLWDDGVGADVRANDGIYSRYITTFDGLGRYGAKVLVSGAPRITKFLSGRRLGSTAPTSSIIQSRRSVTNVETGAFHRVVDAGSFKCMNDNTCQEDVTSRLYGPAKVTDLRVKNINRKEDTVDLVFTAPGDDLMDGQASEYTIRWARSFDELDENFTANPIIEKTVVSNAVYYSTVNPNTIPKTAREMEVFTVRLPELGNFSYVFALTATDQHGVVSPISNFASVSAKYLPMMTETSTQPANAETTTESCSSRDDITSGVFPWYIIVIGFLAFILFFIVLLIFFWWRKTTKETDKSTFLPPTSLPNSVENTFNIPGIHPNISSSVEYSSYIVDKYGYSSVDKNPAYEYADVSPGEINIHLMKKKQQSAEGYERAIHSKQI